MTTLNIYPEEGNKEPRPYVIHCDYCSYHKVISKNTNNDIKLVEIKNASVQKNIPRLENGQVIQSDSISRLKKYKCPGCGRGVTAREYIVKLIPQIEKATENGEEENRDQGSQTGIIGRKIPTNFTG